MDMRRLVAGILLPIALVAAACGDDDDDGATPATDAQPDTTAVGGDDETTVPATEDEGGGGGGGGGTLTMGVFAESSGLDPVIQSGTGLAGGIENAAIYDVLMRWDPETGEYEPRTAESLSPNEDFTQWTLVLRPDITFTDGTPYDSAAVVASIQRHIDANSRTAPLVSGVTEFATPDELTVVFTLGAPNANFPFALASAPGMIVSPTAVAALGEELPTNPVGAGAGPFMIESFLPNEAVTLVRNPDYWGGDVALDELRFVFVPGAEATYENLLSGEFDAAFLRDAATIERAIADGYEGYQAVYSAGGTILMNNGIVVTCEGGVPAGVCDGVADGEQVPTETITSDPRIRRAVAAAIDLDQVNQRVYDGAATMETGLIASESRWYNGIEGPSYDPDLAAELVEEVRAEGTWDGTIRIACHNGSPAWGTTISALLQAVGFETVVNDQRDVQANISEVIVDRNYDLACWGTTIADEAPFFALNRDFNSSLMGRGGDFTGYVNPEVDEALAQANAADTTEEIQATIDLIAEAYAEDVPFLSLGPTPEMVAMSPDLSGLVPSVSTLVFFDQASLAS